MNLINYIPTSAVCFAATLSLSQASELPKDFEVVSKSKIAEIQNNPGYPETSSFRQETQYLDFEYHGKIFTQVTIRLTPEKPLVVNGKKVVVVAAAAGSENGPDFLQNAQGNDGMGVWLAKRGVTFITPTRLGRWNFARKDRQGTWENIPIEMRMPLFHRSHTKPWPESDFTTEWDDSRGPDRSTNYRYPIEGTDLYEYMLAATPDAMLHGFDLGIRALFSECERKDSLLLYWGMSTGGAYLYPFAAKQTPDGYLCWGTSPTGLASYYARSQEGTFSSPFGDYVQKVRERGWNDFMVYTGHLDEDTRAAFWKSAQKNPRFKSIETPMMGFQLATMAQTASMLWNSDFLPESEKAMGFGPFIKKIMETSFPPAELKSTIILDMAGEKDEVMGPEVLKARREMTEPLVTDYKTVWVEGYGHYLFSDDLILTVGNLWLDHIHAGFFHP